MSDDEIFFPEAIKLDLLLALTEKAAYFYPPLLKPDGHLIIDSDAVEMSPDMSVIEAQTGLSMATEIDRIQG